MRGTYVKYEISIINDSQVMDQKTLSKQREITLKAIVAELQILVTPMYFFTRNAHVKYASLVMNSFEIIDKKV